MAISHESRFDIEVLEPLLLMSASPIDCEAIDVADGVDVQATLDAFSDIGTANAEVDGTNESILSLTQEGRSAQCWGDRADFAIEDQGWGIFLIRKGDCVDFVTDVEEICFHDGAFPISELTEALQGSADNTADRNESVESESVVAAALPAAGAGEVEDSFDVKPVDSDDTDLPTEVAEAPGPVPELADELPTFLDDTPQLANEPLTFFDGPPDSAGEPSLDDAPPVIADDDGYFPVDIDDVESPPQELVPDDAPEIDVPVLIDDGGLIPPTELEWAVEPDNANRTGNLTEDVWFADEVLTDYVAAATGEAVSAEQDLATVAAESFVDECALGEPAANEAPIAVDDEINTLQDVAAEGIVSTNDSDADNDSLLFWLETGPDHGSISFQLDGSYVYTPDPGFSGDDSFTYEANDGKGGVDIAEVRIHVAAVEAAEDCPPDAPVNAGPDAQDDENTTLQDTAVSGTVATNDSDPDGDTLSYFVEVGPGHGALDMQEDGTYVYTPDSGFSGDDSFTYEVNDGNGGTDVAEVCLHVEAVEECVVAEPVNQGPVAVDDANSTQQDTAVNGTVASNDSDADGDSLTFWVDEGPINGSIAFNEDGSYTYTPDPGFSGQDSFTYLVNDGNGGTDTATVFITIDPPVNSNPIAAKDYNTITSCDLTVSGNVLENDSDSDCGDILTATLVQGASNGTVTLDANGSYNYSPNDGFVGHDIFTYEVTDGNGGCAMAEVCIEVTPPENAAPDAQDDVNQTDFDTAVDGNVLDNDSDADGDNLVVSLVGSLSNGIVTLDADGNYTYVPNAGFTGQETFTYQVDDGNCGTDIATVTVDVAPAPNETPVAVDDTAETCEDEAVEGNVLANDSDADSDALTVSPLTDVQTTEGGIITLHEDGSFVYRPADGFSGVDSFAYSMSDGNGNTATANVSISVHDIPEPQNDVFTTDSGEAIAENVVLNDGTIAAGSTVSVVEGPSDGTLVLNSDGTFNYINNDGFCGEDSFTYVISGDCGPSNTATVRLVVTEVVYDTTIVSAGNGQIWGDPHFQGDDGGLYDVQGEAGHIYNILSDHGLQVNAMYIPWELHPGSTMVGEVGVTVGDDLIHAGLDGSQLNGNSLVAGDTHTIDGGTLEFDGEYTIVTTEEYSLSFHRRDGWFDLKLASINPFSDNVAPHGLWGLTVDGDSEARNGDYFRDDWNYALQGGGAIDTVDPDGNIVRSERGDDSSYKLYEAANLFSTNALFTQGEGFFRFNARQGTGLTRV